MLFLAPVGGGKSTTAAAFAAAGHEILTDDVAPAKVIAGQTVLCTGPTQIRLCEDAAESFRELDPAAVFLFDKRAFRVAAPVSPHEIPLTAVCLLSDGPDIALTRLSPLEATMALGRECFIRLHRAGSEVRLAHLRQSAEVAAITPVFRLTRPRSLARLGEVVEAVSGTLSWSIIHQR